MSPTIDGRGQSLEEALTAALAELLDCDVDKVEVRLDAPGLGDVEGTVRLHLDVATAVEGGDGTPAAEDVEVDEGSDAEPEAAAEEVDEGGDETPADEDIEEEHVPTSEGTTDEGRTDDDAGQAPFEITVEDLDEEADAAADLLEGLLDAMDLPGDLRIKIHDDHAEVEVLEIGSGALIGRRGQTLEAIQELVRCALQRRFERRSRVKIDAEGYRARRLEKLLEKADEAIEAVLETGEPERLEPMDVFERKAVHHLVAEHDGVVSRSQGREPARRVVIEPE